MANTKMLNIQEVSIMVGVSIPTLRMWYKWKRENPDHDIAKLLPAYTEVGAHKAHYWAQEDVWKLIEFKTSIPQGRGGVMGSVTQRYVKN